MAKTRKPLAILMVTIPIAVFITLQSQGIGVFSIASIFEPRKIQVSTDLVRTGLMMTQSASNVYVAWSGSNGNQDIFFRASNDGGKTFDPVVNLSDNLGRSVTRSMASKGSAAYVAWVDNTYGNSDVFFRRSTDGGKTFDDTMNLSNSNGNSEFPAIDAEGPAVYVVWVDATNGNDEILFRASRDAAATFDDTMNLSNNIGNSESPTVMAVGSNVYVTWHDDSDGNFDVLFRASYDTGKTFTPTINLSNSSGNSGFAVLTAAGSNVYVAWIDDTLGRQDVFFRVSKDGGITFEPAINLSNSKVKSTFPTMDADGPLVCVGWIDESMEMVMFTSCSMEGSEFREPVRISSGKVLKSNTIHVEGIGVYATWVDTSTAINGMFLRASSNAGSSFAPAVNIAVGKIEAASILVKGTNAYVLWSDKKCNDEECISVTVNAYFSRSTDRGLTFETPIRLN